GAASALGRTLARDQRWSRHPERSEGPGREGPRATPAPRSLATLGMTHGRSAQHDVWFCRLRLRPAHVLPPRELHERRPERVGQAEADDPGPEAVALL